ncbi:MAG: CHAT domain-containing protein [bacterium]
MSLAVQAAADNRFEYAITLLWRQIEEDSSLTQAYLALADYFRYSQNLQGGAEVFTQALKSNPDNWNLHLGYALLCKYRDDWNGVFSSCTRALDKGASHPSSVEWLIESALQLKKTNRLPALLRKLKKKPAQAHLYELGYGAWRLRVKSFKKARTSLSQFLKNEDHAAGYKLLGDVLFNLKDFSASISTYKKALRLKQRQDWRVDLESVHKLAFCYTETGQPDSASYYFDKAREIAKKFSAKYTELNIHQDSMTFYKESSQLGKLKEVCLDGIALSAGLNEKEPLAVFSYNLAFVKEKIGDRKHAVKLYLTAAQYAEELNLVDLQAQAFIQIGQIYLTLSELDPALNYLQRGYDLASNAGKQNLKYSALIKIGDVYCTFDSAYAAKQAYTKALRYGQRAQLHRVTEMCFLKLAHLYMRSPESLNDADYYLTLAEHLSKQTFNLHYSANLRWMRGHVALMRNDIEKAETYYLKAIQLGEETGSYTSILAGNAGLIKTYLVAHFPNMAVARSDSLIAFLMEFSSLYVGERAQLFLDLKEDIFMPVIQAYAGTGKLSKVYAVIELYKTINNQEKLTGIKNQIHHAKAEVLKRKIESHDFQIKRNWTDMWELWRKDQRDNLAMLSQQKQKISRLVAERRLIYSQLGKFFPEYFSLFYPSKQKSLEQLRRSLVDWDASFLHYLVGKEFTHVLVVRPDSIYYKRLTVTRDYLNNLLEPLSTSPRFDLKLELLAQLHSVIFKPISEWLPLNSTVFISADESLLQIPFECLITNPTELTGPNDYLNAHFLVEDFSISYTPTAQFAYTAKRKSRPRKKLLAFANPNVQNRGSRNGAESNGVNHVSTSGMPKDEIKKILDAVGHRKTKSFSGRSCTKARFLAECVSYKIIHLSVPGFLERGAELFNRFYFSRESSKEDYLEIHELYNLDTRAELMILSNLSGNGVPLVEPKSLELLLHALRYAGVSSTIINLWNTENRDKTSRLLQNFYMKLKQGMKKTEALREAKIQYMKEVDRNPQNWGALILVGAPSPVPLRGENIDYLIIFTIISVTALLAFVFWQVSRIKKEKGNVAVEL